MASSFSFHQSWSRMARLHAGRVSRICEGNAASQNIPRVRAAEFAAVRLVYGLYIEAIGAPQLENVMRPTWPDLFDRRAAGAAGDDEMSERPGVAPSWVDGANVLALMD